MTEHNQTIEELINYIHSAAHADADGSHAEDLRLASLQFNFLVKSMPVPTNSLTYWLLDKPAHASQFWSNSESRVTSESLRARLTHDFEEWLNDFLSAWKSSPEPKASCRLKLHSFAAELTTRF